MIVVHHLQNSRSQRVLWLLEELGLPYAVTRYERDPRTMLAPPALRKIHPLGKAPIVESGGRALIETGAIVEHLVAVADGRFGPAADVDAGLWHQYLHYAEGSLMPPLFALLVVSRIPLFGRLARKRLLPMFAQHLRFLESELAERAWFAGDTISAADVMMSFPLEAARSRGGLDERYPRLLDWLARSHARPAYRAALDRGGPYAYA